MDYTKEDESKINEVLGEELLGGLPLGEMSEDALNLDIVEKMQRWKLRVMRYR